MRYMFTMMNNARLSVGPRGPVAGRAGVPDGRGLRQGAQAGPRARRAGGGAELDRRAPRRAPHAAHDAGLDRGAARDHLRQRGGHRPGRPPPRRGACAAGCQELADLLTPVSKGWGTDLGVELTSLAIQVFGGMGYIEETGVAQHFRDARIAPIYEGTNGIQAMDLVGRKLPMRAGGAVADYLGYIDADRRPSSARPATTSRRSARPWPTALAALRTATDWLLANGLADPLDALAGATPVPAAVQRRHRRLGDGACRPWPPRGSWPTRHRPTRPSTRAKVLDARFFCEQLLPQAAAWSPPSPPRTATSPPRPSSREPHATCDAHAARPRADVAGSENGRSLRRPGGKTKRRCCKFGTGLADCREDLAPEDGPGGAGPVAEGLVGQSGARDARVRVDPEERAGLAEVAEGPGRRSGGIQCGRLVPVDLEAEAPRVGVVPAEPGEHAAAVRGAATVVASAHRRRGEHPAGVAAARRRGGAGRGPCCGRRARASCPTWCRPCSSGAQHGLARRSPRTAIGRALARRARRAPRRRCCRRCGACPAAAIGVRPSNGQTGGVAERAGARWRPGGRPARRGRPSPPRRPPARPSSTAAS